MRAVIRLCLRYRYRVAAVTLVLLIAGAWLTATSRYDVFPEFAPAEVTVQTEAPGMSPPQVELAVTKPVETAVLGTLGVEMVRSQSIAGLSVVTVLFKDDANPFISRQSVAEAVGSLRLPSSVGTPHLSPLASSTMDLLKIGLISDKMSPGDLRAYADWVVRPRLLAVPGVAHINVFGGEVTQYQVQLDLGRLAARGLAVADVANALRHGLAFAGGGAVETTQQRLVIDLDTGERAPAALAQMVVGQQTIGQPPNQITRAVRLGDVAEVKAGPAIKIGDTSIQGRRGILIGLISQYGSNTRTVTAGVESSLADLAPDLKARGIILYPSLQRPASFIERALQNLASSLAIGAALIALVLILFLRDWRSALISFLAIPASLLTAVGVLSLAGLSLNTMTLGGFAVALGILVDDAVIDVENIIRRLRENAEGPAPRPRLDVILDASVEIRAAVLYATLIILAVFLPVILLHGVQGKFVGALALAVVLAVTASLLVAFTLTPALAAMLLPEGRDLRTEPRWLAATKARYVGILRRVSERPRAAIVALVAATGITVALAFTLGGEFMPTFREGHFVVHVAGLPGTSLEEMTGFSRTLANKLLKLPAIDTVSTQIGRAERGEDTNGPYLGEVHVELKADAGIDQNAVQDEIRAALQVPGLQYDVLTFLGDRLSETLTGETAQFVVRLTGSDLDALDRGAAAIGAAIADVKGIADLQVKSSSGGPTITIALDPARMAQFGISPGDVGDALAAGFGGGEVVGQVFLGDRPIDVAVLLRQEDRADPSAPMRLPVRTASGTTVPLSALAFTQLGVGREVIQHQGGQRSEAVTFDSNGRSPQSLMKDVRATIASRVKLPAGVVLEYGGVAEAQAASTRQLVMLSALALVLIVALLAAAFRRKVLAGVALLNLPFSLIGGLLALIILRLPLSLGAVVGLITVFGISARNAILMLAHFEQLQEETHAPRWDEALITRGATERFRPIAMTALITALGLVPLAAGLNRAGYEIEAPLAIVVLGGLLSSSALCLLALPHAALWAVRRRPRDF